MNADLKRVARELLPPAAMRLVRRWRGDAIRFAGDYPSWQEALAASRGYADPEIVARVRDAMLRVRDGHGAWERDGVVLDRAEPNFALQSALAFAAIARGSLRVLDFGGSLGSTYFQVRSYFPDTLDMRWDVVEQSGFVECGRREFASEHLRFHESLDAGLAAGGVDVILLSSVLPYLENPRATLEAVLAAGCEFVVLDRTPVIAGAGRDRLTVQEVRLPEYQASYPAWFFDEAGLRACLTTGYSEVFRFDSFESWEVHGRKTRSIGGLYRKVAR